MIYFVRHGQTDFNKFEICQGQLDSSLNERGLKEAAQVAERLKDYKFDVVFCSPITRARQTLEFILKYHNHTPIFDDRLKEISMGSLQGSTHPQAVYDEYFKDPHKFGGENKADVFTRIKSFLEDIKKYKGKNILLVAHGSIWRHMKFYMSGDYDKGKAMPMYGSENYKVVKNCEVEPVEF